MLHLGCHKCHWLKGGFEQLLAAQQDAACGAVKRTLHYPLRKLTGHSCEGLVLDLGMAHHMLEQIVAHSVQAHGC